MMNAEKIKILFIEANPDHSRLVESLLAKSAFPAQLTITNSQSVVESFNALKSSVFDIVIFDLTTANSDDPETLDRLIENNSNIPVVILTDISDYNTTEQSLTKHACDFIPIENLTSEHLTVIIKYSIDKHRNLVDLEKINEQTREHDRLKSEFIINISHELRTPLTIFKNIVSNALAGISGNIPNKLIKELQIADDAIDRLAGIVTDFLDISKIEAGKMKLNLETMSIQQVINDTVDMLTSVIDSNYMSVDILMPDEPLYITGDYGKIIQIMSKLIDNATKFVPNCGGRMTIKVKEDSDMICIDVEDNGPGIQGEDINKVFNRFIQIERRVGAGKHGTGLGLAITKQFVNMHGGRIWVENVPYGGAKFRIVLPKKPNISSAEAFTLSGVIDSFANQIDQIDTLCDQGRTQQKQLENIPVENPAIDWNTAMKYCGDENIIIKVAECVILETPMHMASLTDAIETRNKKDIIFFAHKLKGSTLTIGTFELSRKAQAIESAANNDEFDIVEALLPSLHREFKKLRDFLNQPNWIETAKKQEPA